jgi:hypothetical protein
VPLKSSAPALRDQPANYAARVPAYYVIARPEASSNLSRFGGVRWLSVLKPNLETCTSARVAGFGAE